MTERKDDPAGSNAVEVSLARLSAKIPALGGDDGKISAELVAKFGDAYDTYHGVLADHLRAVVKELADPPDDWQRFAELNAEGVDCVILEGFLRRCQHLRDKATRAPGEEPPLLDADGLLRDVNDDLTVQERKIADARRERGIGDPRTGP